MSALISCPVYFAYARQEGIIIMYCLGKETILRRLPAKQLGSARVKNSLKCNVIPLVSSYFLSQFCSS